jgi:hypothetical protein
MMMKRIRLTLLWAAAVLSLSACVVAPYYPYQSTGYGEAVAVADVPPPAPYAEVVPVAPFLGAVWLGGYWGWGGGRHHWVPGRWDRPRAGYYWQPHRWQPIGGRWQLSGGGWMPHR